MIVCAVCSKENEDFFLFCISCGASLQESETEGFVPIPKVESDDDGLLNIGQWTDSVTSLESDKPASDESVAALPSELPVITYADFEDVEPAPALPQGRPNNKSLMKTVVTPIIPEELSGWPQGDTRVAESHPRKEMPVDGNMTAAAEHSSDMELPFLMPLDVGLSPSIDVESEPDTPPTHPVVAEDDVTLVETRAVTEAASSVVATEPIPTETPASPLPSHRPVGNTTADELPIIVPVGWGEPSASIRDTKETLPAVSETNLSPKPTEPREKPRPAKPKARKRTRQTHSKQKNRLCGQIILIRQNGEEGGRFDLFSDSTWLGSNRADINFGNDEFLAPKHAVLFYEAGVLKVRSLDKTNGVFLRLPNNELTTIQSGDYFRIGQELLHYKALADVGKRETITPDQTHVLGSPMKGNTWGLLYQRTSENEHGNVYVLDQETVTLGRDEGEVVFADDGTVSGVHARLTRRNGQVYIEDMGSSNGTYLRVHGTTELDDGSSILVGEQVLRIAL